MKHAEIKDAVRERYGALAEGETAVEQASCCGSPAPGSNKIYNIMMDDYSGVAGYVPEADLGLGCGLPVAFAKIRPGDTVLDLGSGAGNDCFVARHETGAEGKVIGVDFTPSMIRLARENADAMGYNNVEFREGDIEHLPVGSASVDVVVSNCVLNLVPDKAAVFAEIFRVLKPGGHFSISDIVLEGELPEALRHDAEMYAGCVAGAIQKDHYLGLMRDAGFSGLTLQKEKVITLPDELVLRYLDHDGLAAYRAGKTGIFSISVYGERPAAAQTGEEKTEKPKAFGRPRAACCGAGAACC